ncbi:hypothetical protein ONZ43_g5254 [Nemania bipapillata]|uniref:Uncharacterized protein n=1 Tax=Nemania bipapillata TaxID=110536 RepID=A0ACC2ICW2_9PEZI|nr:hypothetical protein ONZ43_g5254 [Nemania bipapillata]
MLFAQWYGSPRYAKLEGGPDESPSPSPTTRRFVKIGSIAVIVSLLCALSFGAGWMLGAADTRPSAALPDVIPSLPVTGISRQQVMTLHEMQGAPPANGSHEPAWDKLIPNGLGYVRHPTLAPEVSVVAVFHQLHCLYTVRRAYYAAYAASIGQEFNRAGVREPDHVAHCFDYLQQSLTCAADIGIEPLYGGHYPDVMFGRQCRDFSEIQKWAAQWRVLNGIASYLDQNSLPHPSFDADGPLTLNLPPQAERARSTAVDALQELLDLLQGPIACMLPKCNNTSLQVISRYDIARKVPIQGTISFAELAEATDLHVNDLRRIMRYAMSFHRLFTEPQEGFVAHSAGSKKLATDDTARAGLAQSMDEFYGSYARVCPLPLRLAERRVRINHSVIPE